MRFACVLAAAGLLGHAQEGIVQRVALPAAGDAVVEVEVRFGRPGPAVRLEAGGALEATPDANDTRIELRLVEGAKTLASETELLKPLPHRDWGGGAYEELEAEGRAMPGWRGRWFALRAELSGGSVWYWFDGRAIGVAPRAAAGGEAVLRLPAGAEARGLKVTASRSKRGGYQPLELAGYGNLREDGAPAGWMEAGGVPFRVGGGVIDVSRAGLRLRKKPSGPGTLYQKQFNRISAMDGDPLTILLRVPKRYYRRAWLLASASGDAGLSPKMTVRLARYRGEGGVMFADREVSVPRAGETARPGMPPSVMAGSERLWVIEVPLDPGALQDVLAADVLRAQGNTSETLKFDADVPWLDVELTRELRADLNCMLPLGPRSGVKVHAVTLEESPVRMVATSPALGHLFATEEAPRFDVYLENVTAVPQSVSAVLQAHGPDGALAPKRITVRLGAGEKRTERMTAPKAGLGHFDATFRLADAARGAKLMERRTTYAVLPPDTRKAERDSPFGLWSWGGGHLTPSHEVESALMRRAGARHTLGGSSAGKRGHGIGAGTDIVTGIYYSNLPVPGEPDKAAREMLTQMKSRVPQPRYWQIYWEDQISERHHRLFPPAPAGRPRLELNDAEKARFEAYWERALAYANLSKSELPREKLALGAWMNFTEEFLHRGFPANLLDALSLEVGGYRMQPERPPDIDDVNGLYFLEEWKKRYGYEKLDTIMVESLFHGTAPGYLSERDQANYYVRDMLLGLAYGVKLFGMSAMITDVADDYYRSNWGSVGLCHRAPEPSPKPAYTAYATMTRVLDRARYAGRVETGTFSVYALHFVAGDGENVYALWTTRGRRRYLLAIEDLGGVVIDAMGRETQLGEAGIELSEAPVYLKTRALLTRVVAGPPVYAERPPANSTAVDALAGLEQWRVREGRDELLEEGNSRYPRRAGAFRFVAAKDAVHGPVVEVSPGAVAGSPLLPMYSVLERREPLRLAGAPRRLGLWVKGNSAWGRITFEVTDAKGERWTGVGGSEDSYGHGFINFDGWRWVEVDLPGHFRPDYLWPHTGNWTARGGDAVVDYPLSLNTIIVELRDHVVYGTRLEPVRENRIRLSGLRAVY